MRFEQGVQLMNGAADAVHPNISLTLFVLMCTWVPLLGSLAMHTHTHPYLSIGHCSIYVVCFSNFIEHPRPNPSFPDKALSLYYTPLTTKLLNHNKAHFTTQPPGYWPLNQLQTLSASIETCATADYQHSPRYLAVDLVFCLSFHPPHHHP